MNVMNRIVLRKTACLPAVILACLIATALEIPAQEPFPRPAGAVNDFAGVIPEPYKNRMENLSREVLEKTGTSIVVATIATIGKNEFNQYVNRLYSDWGIGKKGEDKGVLIVLALKERKVRIETGYGVEGILPDGLVGEIRDRAMIPWLKTGDYGRGLAEGMIAIAAVVAKNADVTLTGSPTMAGRQQPHRARDGGNWLLWLLAAVILIPLLGTRQGRDMLPWILLMLVSSGRGGGGNDGGGFGDFGGGGFGGFGGGSSGGGGAGGDF
jgi:uncharacterized protein